MTAVRVSRAWLALVVALGLGLVITLAAAYGPAVLADRAWASRCHALGGHRVEQPREARNPLIAPASDPVVSCQDDRGTPIRVR